MKKLLLILIILFTQCTQRNSEFNGDFEILDRASGKPSGWLYSINPAQEKEYTVKIRQYSEEKREVLHQHGTNR